MQITSSTQTGASTPASSVRPAEDKAQSKAKSNDSSHAAAPSSAKVTISEEAKKKHYETKDAASERADTASDQPQLSRNKSALPSAETEKPTSAVKSLVYGALNLPPPEEAAKHADKAYSAGKWVGALGTVIGVATLLMRFI